MYGYIYITENLVNGKIYIGKKTGSIFDNSYYGSGIRINNAIKKYGKTQFKVSFLEWASSLDELNLLEIQYIEKYNQTHILYNIAKGGDGGDTMSANPLKDQILKKRELNNISKYGVTVPSKLPESKALVGQKCKDWWENRFNSPEFDMEKFKEMCSIRSKNMWNKRGISELDRQHRSLKQSEYVNQPGVKENLSTKAKENWKNKSKLYEVTFPDGHKEYIKCLRGWCQEHDYPYYTLYNSLRNNRPSSTGWLVKIL